LPKAEAADPQLRRGINTTKVVLQPREIIVPFEIGDVFKEVNIEGDNIEEHVIRMMATRLANDLEELYVNGDVLGRATLQSEIMDGGSATQYVRDTYLALQDGWARKADAGHVVDAAGSGVGLGVFGAALRAMPSKYRRNKGNLRFFVSPDLAQLYVERLATRNTVLGDKSAEGTMHTPFGVKMVEVPLWDHTPSIVQHVALAATTPVALRYNDISDVIVTPGNLGYTPVVPYIPGVDYTLDLAAGTIARTGGGAIADGSQVKVTYKSSPQILLTHEQNFIIGIGRDIRIEKDRDIFKGVNQYAITAKVAVEFEEVDAVVKVVNVGRAI
jgi:hypothetical protein